MPPALSANTTRPEIPIGTNQYPWKLCGANYTASTVAMSAVTAYNGLTAYPTATAAGSTSGNRYVFSLQAADLLCLAFVGWGATDPNNQTASIRLWLAKELIIDNNPPLPSSLFPTSSQYLSWPYYFACELALVVGNTATPMVPNIGATKWVDTITVTTDKSLGTGVGGGVRLFGGSTDDYAVAFLDQAGAQHAILEVDVGTAEGILPIYCGM